jgi:hypothetical protein
MKNVAERKLKPFGTYLPPELITRMRLESVRTGKEMCELVADALQRAIPDIRVVVGKPRRRATSSEDNAIG